MCPVTSHTLGPSAQFSSPAVTRFDQPSTFVSYAAVNNPSAGDDPDAQQEIKCWRDSPNTSTSKIHNSESTFSVCHTPALRCS